MTRTTKGLLFAQGLLLTSATCAILAPGPLMAQNQSQRGYAKASDPKPPYHLRDCMVYIPSIKDPALREWCLKQSERMP